MACVLAVLIGASLALYPLPHGVNESAVSAASAAPGTASTRDATAIDPSTADLLNKTRDLLIPRARDLINRRGDFYLILAGIKPGGMEVQMLLAAPSPGDLHSGFQQMRDHIAAGEFTVYGWVATMHAAAAYRPDGMFVETRAWGGPIRRWTVGIDRDSNGHFEFFRAEPISYRPAQVAAIQTSLDVPYPDLWTRWHTDNGPYLQAPAAATVAHASPTEKTR